MLTRRVIPCLDVKNGRNVRGVRFSADIDAGDPVELAARYDREGADELVFYDITASAEGRNIMVDLVERVASQVFIPLSVGGGVRTIDDMYLMLRSGAEKVSINSAAHQDPDLIRACADRFGSQCVVLSIDALRDPDSDPPRWTIYLNGGRVRTSLDAVEIAQRGQDLGAGEIVLNRAGDGLADQIHLAEELGPIFGFVIKVENEAQDIAGTGEANDNDISRTRDCAAKY